MKNLPKGMFSRVIWVVAALLLQLVVLITFILRFEEYFVYFYGATVILSLFVILAIVNGRSNPAYKIAWMVPVLVFPIFGSLFYLMFGGNKLSHRQRKRLRRSRSRMVEALHYDESLVNRLARQDEDAANQSRYIQRYACCPPYRNTYTEYFPSGESKWKRLLEELEKAEKYIFLEYFIIQEGVMWNSVLEILQRKVKEGVEVRMIYDDFGCITKLPSGYYKKLRAMGIDCVVFNPVLPILSMRLNNRDHRKIVIIDGHTGFTGGINLADEYINEIEKFGQWRDAGIMLKGEGVWSLTVLFLTSWDYLHTTEEVFENYRPQLPPHLYEEEPGYVQPYGDNPLDDEDMGETVYLNLINKAKRYVYIATPYLIIDNEMVTALRSAAKAGVDVRILMPHIPDKKYVHTLSRAYYQILMESGVRIYEFTPGFTHSKTFVVDDEYATVGTINLDYRSLYLHFECGVWLYQTKSVADVKEDFINSLAVSEEVSQETIRRMGSLRRLYQAVLRLFAPLM